MSPTSDKTVDIPVDSALDGVTEVTDTASVKMVVKPKNQQLDLSRTQGMSVEDLGGTRTVIEVKFDENARVSDCF